MSRDYRKEYDNYQGTSEQKKNRAQRNTARRQAARNNRVRLGDNIDIDHKKPIRSGGSNSSLNIRLKSKSSNRASNGHKKGETQKHWK